MTNKMRTREEPSKKRELHPALRWMPEAEKVALNDPKSLLNSAFVDNAISTTSRSGEIGNAVHQTSDLHYSQHTLNQIDDWDNEGGRTEYVNV